MNAAAKPVRPKSDIAAYMHERGARARVAARRIARADTGTKNAALFAQAQAILADSDASLEATPQDMRAGRNANPYQYGRRSSGDTACHYASDYMVSVN